MAERASDSRPDALAAEAGRRPSPLWTPHKYAGTVTVSQATRDRVVQQAGALSTAAVRRLEADLDWYRVLSAQDRSWIGLVAQAGVAAFVAWLRDTGGADRGPDQQVTAEIFGSAPARADLVGQPRPDPRHRADRRRRRRGGGPPARRARRRGRSPGGRAALLAGGRVLRRPGLCGGRRGPGRLGRAARGARRRRRRAGPRPTTRCSRAPPPWAGGRSPRVTVVAGFDARRGPRPLRSTPCAGRSRGSAPPRWRPSSAGGWSWCSAARPRP